MNVFLQHTECSRVSITWFLNFVHGPEFQIARKHNFTETGLSFRLHVRGRRHLLCWVQWFSLACSQGTNRVGVSLPSPEDGSRSSFRKVVLPSYIEFWTMDKVQKPSDPECYVPLSQTFRFYKVFQGVCLFSLRICYLLIYGLLRDGSVTSDFILLNDGW
jgi:hypothetical protein